MALGGRPPLLGGEGGDADHAHVAVAPGLTRHPLDGVVVVPFVAHAELALRLVAAPHLADHVHVAVGHETLGVAAFDHAVPLGATTPAARP